MLVSDILRIALPHDPATTKPLSMAACKRLRNGDQIGYHFRGNRESYWVPARVICNDTRDGILAVQCGHEPMETFWYSKGDELIHWPQSTSGLHPRYDPKTHSIEFVESDVRSDAS